MLTLKAQAEKDDIEIWVELARKKRGKLEGNVYYGSHGNRETQQLRNSQA